MNSYKNLTIGIDIDGTVTDPGSILPFMNEAFGKNLTLADCIEYNLATVYNIPEEVFEKWLDEQGEHLYRCATLHDVADQILKQWHQAHRLVYISARDEKHLPVTYEWLERFEIPYHSVNCIGSHDKLSSAKKWGVDVFLEDRKENAVQLAEELQIPVFLFDTPYNQGTLPSLVKRINTWKEGNILLNQLAMQTTF
ncbi:hypothetical protein ACQCN2_19960 [Brevibacillus ginsengisoli]|uniref:hypothetical protein n=1 Tax=Brevibacillus ginsengisoli TaxID=363854 RepID=UPI003CEB3528